MTMGAMPATRGSTAPVSQLVYIWGPRPPESAMNWLEKRARRADWKRRVYGDE